MNYPKAIHLMGGEVITITQSEYEDIIKDLNEKPTGFLEVQGELINKSSISKVGNHSSTAQLKNLDKIQSETEMKVLGKGDLVDEKKEEEKQIAIESALKEKRVMIGKEYEDYMNNLKIKQIKE